MIGVLGVSFLLCVGAIGLLLYTKVAWCIATDVPNSRSLHARIVPRVGGWGLVPAALLSVVLFGAADALLIGLAVVLFAVSYADDRKGLPIFLRLTIHGAAAAALLAWGPFHLPLSLALPAAIGIVWIANLFNFMDGADGLAGGMAMFAFGVYAAVAAASGLTTLALWSMAFAGASAGFLLFNFSPARVFLGDAGSVTLGFFAGAFGIWGWAEGIWPFWFPFLVAAPFFLDASVTLARRVVRREEFWKAHHEHYYQRLIRSGWSHRRTALWEYVVMACSALLALAMLDWSAPAQYAGAAAALAAYAAMACAIDRRWSRFIRTSSAQGDGPAAAAQSISDERAAASGTESARESDEVVAYAQAYKRPQTTNKA